MGEGRLRLEGRKRFVTTGVGRHWGQGGGSGGRKARAKLDGIGAHNQWGDKQSGQEMSSTWGTCSSVLLLWSDSGLEGSLRMTKPGNGWVGRVLKGHRDMEWVGLEGSFQITEPWNGWVGLDGSLMFTEPLNGWVGLEGSFRITEPWNGWVALGWKGPYRPQSPGMVGLGWVGLEGSLQITEPWNGWVGLEGSFQITEP